MRKISLLFGCLLCMLAATAQIRGNEIRVMVSPDHTDWNYRLNDKCTFTVRVLKAQNLLQNVTVDYELGPEMYPTEVKKGVLLKNGELKLQGTMKTPGFLRCKVTAHVGDRKYEGLATAAYAPEQLQPITEFPVDFREFWVKELEGARRTSLQPLMTLLPERCTATVNVYHVSFQTDRWGSRFYGVLCVPKKKVSIRLCCVCPVQVFVRMPAMFIQRNKVQSHWKLASTVFPLLWSNLFMIT